ncbi:MAG: hypothetical protein ACE5IE_04715 [Dehalococcoidia bacterium]
MAIRLAGEDYITKHADLDALAADDHTQYVLRNILTTQGDLFVRGASAIDRLGVGAKRFFLRVNEAGDSLEYVKGYEFGQFIRPWQWELAFFHWTTTVTGSGNIPAQGYGTFALVTGITAGSTARGRGYRFGWLFGSSINDFDWAATFFRNTMSVNGQAWLKIDTDTAADPTDEAFGWRLDNTALKGIVHDGISLTVVDLNVAMVGFSVKDLFLKFTAGVKIEWYVDGVKKGESLNIPPGGRSQDVYPVFAVANNGDASDNVVDIWRHGWIWT